MIDRAYVQRMARYNRWQNENLYGVADRLPAEERAVSYTHLTLPTILRV